ncbi:Reverse transcriptase (RNA-dependent DNA polymerase) [Phytophthora infestans]|uniref:Reverse transcriptase (RNA-dependent DNA polymerase) n=1 Tax=Phytophthora infestans TaxID=4787 RepID=A0A833WFZ0_PHYIN|nr:Reverse transcriptase (RNA-dependent DNA polymerase) [Phytophthora infestans]
MTTYTGQADVGLLLTPSCPVRNLQDVTRRHVSSSDLMPRYLLVRGALDSVATYIHVVYAPVQPSQRAEFFATLPRTFEDDSHHIVLGDLNTVLSKPADYSERIAAAKAALNENLEEQAYYASKQKFASDLDSSERCSKPFFRPPQVLHKTPIPVDSAEELESTCTAFSSYWSRIYCSPSQEFGHHKPKWDRIKLSQIHQHTRTRHTSEAQAYLNSPFTANEFYWALSHTSTGKTPGPDGLPVEYYKVDLPLWSRILEVVYAAQLQRDRKLPSNYRPISLLNVDAKLGPKILAYRLGSALGSLLHSDQYEFVPGRDIRHAHLRFQALSQLLADDHSPAGAVLLDFAKAFDSVVWDALDMVLMHFGLGDSFRRWLGAGVRQGDPLSPALFVLFIEPLLNFLRVRLREVGLRSGSITHSVISFADDCTGLLYDLSHTKFFLALVDDFCVASGMSLNKDKTVVLPFQPWTAETEPLSHALIDVGVIVVGNTGRTKLLGIFYGPNLSDADRLQHFLFEMKTRCSLWLHRARTLRGQVVILQQVILPVLWYTASVCHIPQTGFQDQLLQLISRFICRFRSSNALPRAWWFLPPHNGGFALRPFAT